MEHKAWLWKRKSSERTITTIEKCDILSAGNEQENEKKLELEKSILDLKEQLSSANEMSSAKRDLLTKQAKLAEEATAGQKKAEKEVDFLKKELADALLHKAVAEERIISIDATLQESMKQLNVVKEEHQHYINDASTKISRIQERAGLLEKKLGETNNSFAKLGVEYKNLSRILEVKEKMIENLTETKSQNEESIMALLERLDSSEKDNSSLKYEVSMLQKELDIRNQDREFHLKSADAAHKQYLESMKKIAKLESECQRLRVMVRKRLPGPAAVAKMRNEVEVLANSSTVDKSRKKTMLPLDSTSSRDLMLGNDYESPSMRTDSLVQRLHAVEGENKILSEILAKKNNELQSSRIMFARTVSKLSHAEKQLEDLSKGQSSLELARNSFSSDVPLTSVSKYGGNDDTVSCAESWASALISELEFFRNGKTTSPSTTTAGVSELSLMDDFIEMEKLAIVCVNSQSEGSNMNSLQAITSLALKKPELEVVSSESTGKEMVTVKTLSNLTGKDYEVQSSSDPLDGKHDTQMFQQVANKKAFLSSMEKPLCRMIELVEGIIQKNFVNNLGGQKLAVEDESTYPFRAPFSPTRHVARVFLCEASELCSVLQHFIVVCNDLLLGKADIKKFICELVSTLEWIISRCFSLQDASTMEEAIKKLCNDNGSHADEFKSLNIETNEIKPEEFALCESSPSLLTSWNGQYKPQPEENESNLHVENRRLKTEIENLQSKKKDLEEMVESARDKNESLSTQLKQADEIISKLQAELMNLKCSNSLIEDQIENQKLITEDIGTQLTVANAELNRARQEYSSLEVELEDKSNCVEELEATCLELQLQLESMATKDIPKYEKGQKESQIRTDWEISAASQKLAECQATILDLGKQLKSLASPKDAALFDKVISPSSSTKVGTKVGHRTQLLDQMQAEDEAASEYLKSPNTKEIICTEIKPPLSSTISENNPNGGLLYGSKLSASSSIKTPDEMKLVLVPKKQKGGVSFLQKLLSRRKKGSSKKKPLAIGP